MSLLPSRPLVGLAATASFLVLAPACQPCPECEECEECPAPPKPDPAEPANDFAEWRGALPGSEADLSEPTLPQVDQGTLGIQQDNDGDGTWDAAGTLWAWGSGGSTEAFGVTDLDAFEDQWPHRVVESDDLAKKGGSAFTLAQFQAELSGKCGPSDQSCGAYDDWSTVAVPIPGDFPVALPPGALGRVARAQQTSTASCPGGTATTTTQGWLYRIEAVHDSQVKWTVMYFLDDQRPVPDRCAPPGSTDTEIIEAYTDVVTGPPGPRRFVEQLSGANCGSPAVAWCGACGTSNGDCVYGRIDLDWQDWAP